MAARECAALAAAVGALQAKGVAFALVHESALMGWGIDNNAFLECVDVLVIDDEGFRKLGLAAPAWITRSGLPGDSMSTLPAQRAVSHAVADFLEVAYVDPRDMHRASSFRCASAPDQFVVPVRGPLLAGRSGT